ncbi:MAG: nucleotidyltransferase family protein [Clostridia bacterium]|nr:nucleotidyltransferase family protein [Clostridia bacterium]
MKHLLEIMTCLIRSVLSDEDYGVMPKIAECYGEEKIPEEVLERMLVISSFHGMAHVVGTALERYNLLKDGKIKDEFDKRIRDAKNKFALTDTEYERVCAAFENAKIAYLPLKGAVIRDFYPEKWLRVSADIDVLVKKEDLERAGETLEKELLYKKGKSSAHDIPYTSANGMTVELHFDLVEEKRMPRAEKVLNRVWKYASHPDNSYKYEMSDDMFYYFHIAHMAKHMEEGGIGIKAFADLWVLDNRKDYDKEKREKLIDEGGLSEFEKAAKALTAKWFDGKEPQEDKDTLLTLEKYVIKAGTYGTLDNRVSVSGASEGSKGRYLLSRVFMPYEKLVLIFPSLEKHKNMIFFYQIARIGHVIRRGRVKSGLDEAKAVEKSLQNPENEKTAEMLKKFGIIK